MSKYIVAKFGGTSVKTAAAIKQVAEIVQENHNIKVVVVSAVGGVTNLLVALCNSTLTEQKDLLNKIQDIHLNLAQDLGLLIDDKIIGYLRKLKKLLTTTLIGSEQADNILSSGEDLSSLIVHEYFKLQGILNTHVDIRGYLITDSHFGRATPDLIEIAERFLLFPDNLCVTQGFIGKSKDGSTTTLGRGGSDYSAALIAEALDADELLIYTDVPGVYTMDPNLIKSAHLIEELCFQEMAEMANFGAKILHPATLEPCVRKKIPIRILSTFEPHKSGTYISIIENKDLAPQVRAITMRKNQVLVTIKSLKMLDAYGFLSTIFTILAKHKISVDLITTSEVSVALTIDATSMGSHAINPFISDRSLTLELEQFAEINIEENLVLLAVIGSGLTVPGVIQKTLQAIESYTIRLVCYGASNSSIGVLVNSNDAEEMAKILHNQLLGGN